MGFFGSNRKGPNLSGIDPVSGKLVPLFNPRRQRRKRHFTINGPLLLGRTQSGRATVEGLEMNLPTRVELREGLIAGGRFPPERDR